jgi:hypothetical protein
MNAAMIVTAISAVSQILRTKLQSDLPAGSVPTETLLRRAVQVLIASKAIDPKFLENADIVKMLLENIVSIQESNPDGKLTTDALQQLLKTCLGTASGAGALTKINRKSVKVKKSGAIEYKYHILQPVPTVTGGIGPVQFQLLVDAAWDRWSEAIPRLTTIQVPKNKANMLIGFTPLDGTGNKLAQATVRQPGTNEYRLQIDLAEKWTPSKLLGTLIHELGHILGMEHINTPESIMYYQASNQPTDPKKVQLTQADKDAIPSFWKS